MIILVGNFKVSLCSTVENICLGLVMAQKRPDPSIGLSIRYTYIDKNYLPFTYCYFCFHLRMVSFPGDAAETAT